MSSTWGRTLSTAIAPESPIIRDGEDEVELKMQFAKIAFKLGDDWRQTGFQLFQGPSNYGRAMQCVCWINDELVQIEMQRLRENPEESLPSLADLKKRLWTIANDPKVKPNDQIKAIDSYAEIDGVTKRPANFNVGNTITQNVLRVPAKPVTTEEQALYETRLEMSQLKLVNDARSSR